MHVNDSYIFERSYVTNVLGLEIPINESTRLSTEFRAKVLEEQRIIQE